MIANMTNTEIFPVGLEHLVQAMPVLVQYCAMCPHFVFLKELSEPKLCRVSLGLLILMFYGHILTLSFQYLARNPDKGLIFMTNEQL